MTIVRTPYNASLAVDIDAITHIDLWQETEFRALFRTLPDPTGVWYVMITIGGKQEYWSRHFLTDQDDKNTHDVWVEANTSMRDLIEMINGGL